MEKREPVLGSPKSAGGFTLIELMVVVAIISILAAIIFPVFSKARERARQTSCLSNVRQLSAAWLSYTNDHDDIPPSWQMRVAGQRWYDKLGPYIRNTQLLRCSSKGGDSVFYRGWDEADSTYASDYCYNLNVGGQDGVRPAPLGTIEPPSQRFFLLDHWKGMRESGDYFAAGSFKPTEPGDFITGSAVGGINVTGDMHMGRGPHQGGWNIAYCDGHAKFKKNLMELTWMP